MYVDQYIQSQERVLVLLIVQVTSCRYSPLTLVELQHQPAGLTLLTTHTSSKAHSLNSLLSAGDTRASSILQALDKWINALVPLLAESHRQERVPKPPGTLRALPCFSLSHKQTSACLIVCSRRRPTSSRFQVLALLGSHFIVYL